MGKMKDLNYLEKEISTILIENKDDLIAAIYKMGYHKRDNFESRVVDFLKCFIITTFNLTIEETNVILSDIYSFENDLNFLIQRRTYNGKYTISN